jgi:hypothetical protein
MHAPGPTLVAGLTLVAEHADKSSVADQAPRPIECLACGAVRLVSGSRIEATGECERCGYVGWTYADAADAATRRMIMNGLLARGTSRPRLVGATPPSCRWREHRVVRARTA